MNNYRAFLIDTLRSGLVQIVELVQAFPGDLTSSALRPAEWPVRQHVHHLRHIEGRYLERVEGVLAGSNHVPSKVEHLEAPANEPLESMLSGFVACRERALVVFNDLPDEHWLRVFTHPTIWGEVTIEWWAERFIQHTAEHLDELWMLKQLAGLQPEAYERLTASGVLTLPK